MKTTEEREDRRPITITSDPPADEPTPEMERGGADLEPHPMSTDDSDSDSVDACLAKSSWCSYSSSRPKTTAALHSIFILTDVQTKPK